MDIKNPFRQAKPYLATGFVDKMEKDIHICSALETILTTNEIFLGRKDCLVIANAQKHIMRQLAPHHSVEGWVMTKIPGFRRALNNTGRPFVFHDQHLCNEVQAFRHRWLDFLADEFDRGNIKL